MKIQVYDFRKVPNWVQVWNLVNLFLFGLAIGDFADSGFESLSIAWFTLYSLTYAFTIGLYFIPRKTVFFPKGFIYHFLQQWIIPG